jgi:hypothetical protein
MNIARETYALSVEKSNEMAEKRAWLAEILAIESDFLHGFVWSN